MTVTIGPAGIAPADVVAVARHGDEVVISPEAITAVAVARAHIDALAASPVPAYGVSTGFGALATRHIPPERRRDLQRSLIRSHAAGSGPPVELEVVRAMMLLRLKTLASGLTGVRPVLVETYAALLNAGITPAVPEYGSLGCSGDLAPLAHVAMVLMGEGDAVGPDGALAPAAELLLAARIEPVVLQEKEGLALINGTDGMLGALLLASTDLHLLCTTADVATAMSVEALLGTDRVFAADLHEPIRPHPGQAASAANLLALLAGSAIVASHRIGDTGCRTPTRCAAPPRSPGPSATPSTTPTSWPGGSCGPSSTTRSSSPTGGSSPTATSTAPPSPTCSTSSPSSPPTWPP